MFPHRAQTIWHGGASRRSKSAARLDACIEFDQIQNPSTFARSLALFQPILVISYDFQTSSVRSLTRCMPRLECEWLSYHK